MKIIAVICLAPFAYLWQGYTLSKLWVWFMVPAFHLPALSLGYAVGVGITVSFTITRWRKGTEPELGEWITYNTLTPAMTLLAGWIVKLFIGG
jgi:hypothetical protein